MFLSTVNLKRLAIMGGVSLLAMTAPMLTAARAADLGGDCCADLEERVATLEATSARKGNRKVSLTISGHVNQGLLVWDDGKDSDAYVVSNSNDDLAMFRFEGGAKFSPGWRAGYLIELEVGTANSADVSQFDDDAGGGLGISESSMFIESEQYGRLTWGFTGQPSDGASEVDLSGTGYVASVAVSDVAGSFNFRLPNGNFSGITLGDVFGDLNGDTFNIIRYDTPTLGGFTLSASWGEDDIWDVALNYAKAHGDFEVEAAIAYTENNDGDNGGAKVDEETIAGSVAVIHAPTGLNLSFSAGTRDFNDEPRRDEATYYYVKGGIYRQFNSLGKTAFYGEFGQFNDMFFTDDASALTGTATDMVIGSEGKVYGLGLVQYIDAAAMQVYIGYRHYDVDFDVVDLNGAAVASSDVEEFDTLKVGGRIEF